MEVLNGYLNSFGTTIEEAWLHHIARMTVMDYAQGDIYEEYLGYYSRYPESDNRYAETVMQQGSMGWRSAPAGTGIIAGGAIRSVCEVLGIQDVVAKSLGSANPHNVLKACVNGLKSQSSPKILSAIRGKKISDIVEKREAK